MPIEISELHIRANVSEQPNRKATGTGNRAGTKPTAAPDPSAEMVKKSVDAILDTLKRKNER